MIPNWFPWIFVGGLVFIALSFTASKYRDKDYKRIQALQDFISGSILVGFTGVLVPDMFPKMKVESILTFGEGLGVGRDDLDLQVGPPRLAGR